MKLPKSSGPPKKPKLLAIRRVHGVSMLPTVKPGKLVVARPTRRLRVGQIIMIHHNQLDKLKRIIKLRATELYVVGDNPESSTDSRSFGWISRDLVIGVMVWPRRSSGLDASEPVDTKGDANH